MSKPDWCLSNGCAYWSKENQIVIKCKETKCNKIKKKNNKYHDPKLLKIRTCYKCGAKLLVKQTSDYSNMILKRTRVCPTKKCNVCFTTYEMSSIPEGYTK